MTVRSGIKETSSRGFTIVELLVTITVSLVLTSIPIIYGSRSRMQVALFVETAKVAGMLDRAKSLALSFSADPASQPCGYGVFLDRNAQTVTLYSYRPSFTCDQLSVISPAYRTVMQTVPIESGVRATTAGNDDIVFFPPYPKIMGSTAAGTSTDGLFTLQTQDGSSTRTINVNSYGQITY